jgi:hypothetical protein
MRVCFIKTSHKEYTLECVRDNGSVARGTLEAKSYLKHDVVHFVYEREAKLRDSFYGMVNAGQELASLTPQAMKVASINPSEEALTTEIIVGALQGALTKETLLPHMDTELAEYITLQGRNTPPHLTMDVLKRVFTETKQLLNQYARMKTGERLCVTF